MPSNSDFSKLKLLAQFLGGPTPKTQETRQLNDQLKRYELLEQEGVAIKNLLHELDIQQTFYNIQHEVFHNIGPKIMQKGKEWASSFKGMKSTLERVQKGLFNTGQLDYSKELSQQGQSQNTVQLGGNSNKTINDNSATLINQNQNSNNSQVNGSNGNNQTPTLSEESRRTANRTSELYSALSTVTDKLNNQIHSLEQTHAKIRNMKTQIDMMGNNTPKLTNTGLVSVDYVKNDPQKNNYKIKDTYPESNNNRFDISRTSTGCVCASYCDQHQGQPFLWCRVDKKFKINRTARTESKTGGGGSKTKTLLGTTCSVAQNSAVLDPLGYDHKLYLPNEIGRLRPTDEVWDYCVRQHSVTSDDQGTQFKGQNTKGSDKIIYFPDRIYTAHPGCECLHTVNKIVGIKDQIDFYASRLRSQYSELISKKGGSGKIDFLDAQKVVPLSKDGELNHIPLKDRLTAILVSVFKAEGRDSHHQSICRVLGPPSGAIGPSKGYAVCPVNPACLSQKSTDWTSDWFSKSKDFFHTWDFCATPGWNGNEQQEDPDMTAIIETLVANKKANNLNGKKVTFVE